MRKKVGVVGAALLAVVACDVAQQAGEEGLRGSGDAAADAGEWLADAGRALIDAGEELVDASDGLHDAGAAMRDASEAIGNDADAQEPPAGGPEVFDVPCDKTYEWTLRTGTGATARQAALYAELELGAAPSAVVVQVCRAPVPFQCPAGYTCTGNPPPSGSGCETPGSAQVGPTVRVQCGFASAQGAAELSWTYRYERAVIAVWR